MMSELAHQYTDIETHKPTRNQLTNVVPLPRKAGEISDPAELSELKATSLLMSTLRHESRAGLRGDDLAEVIEEYLGQRSLSGEQTLNMRLSQIVMDSNPDDDSYDARLENDPVFANITDALVSRGKNQNSAQQRSAARKLLDLRVALPDFITDDDDTWLEVTSRLMD